MVVVAVLPLLELVVAIYSCTTRRSRHCTFSTPTASPGGVTLRRHRGKDSTQFAGAEPRSTDKVRVLIVS